MGLKIIETRVRGRVRLVLSGDLDSAWAHDLDRRLLTLRAQGLPVQLSLSRVQFVDSAGISVLIRALQHSRESTWRFEIDQDAPHFIRRRFDLLGIGWVLASQTSPADSSSPMT